MFTDNYTEDGLLDAIFEYIEETEKNRILKIVYLCESKAKSIIEKFVEKYESRMKGEVI